MRCEYHIVQIRRTDRQMSIDALASYTGVHPSRIICYIEAGLIEPAGSGAGYLFEPSDVVRIRAIERLRSDLGINLPGVAVILNMAERIRTLQRELDLLRHRTTESR